MHETLTVQGRSQVGWAPPSIGVTSLGVKWWAVPTVHVLASRNGRANDTPLRRNVGAIPCPLTPYETVAGDAVQ